MHRVTALPQDQQVLRVSDVYYCIFETGYLNLGSAGYSKQGTLQYPGYQEVLGGTWSTGFQRPGTGF